MERAAELYCGDSSLIFCSSGQCPGQNPAAGRSLEIAEIDQLLMKHSGGVAAAFGQVDPQYQLRLALFCGANGPVSLATASIGLGIGPPDN